MGVLGVAGGDLDVEDLDLFGGFVGLGELVEAFLYLLVVFHGVVEWVDYVCGVEKALDCVLVDGDGLLGWGFVVQGVQQ